MILIAIQASLVAVALFSLVRWHIGNKRYKKRMKMLDEMKHATDMAGYHIKRKDNESARAQLERWDEINELYDIEWKKFKDQ